MPSRGWRRRVRRAARWAVAVVACSAAVPLAGLAAVAVAVHCWRRGLRAGRGPAVTRAGTAPTPAPGMRPGVVVAARMVRGAPAAAHTRASRWRRITPGVVWRRGRAGRPVVALWSPVVPPAGGCWRVDAARAVRSAEAVRGPVVPGVRRTRVRVAGQAVAGGGGGGRAGHGGGGRAVRRRPRPPMRPVRPARRRHRTRNPRATRTPHLPLHRRLRVAGRATGCGPRRVRRGSGWTRPASTRTVPRPRRRAPRRTRRAALSPLDPTPPPVMARL